jgi:hypothetical protein
MFTEQKEYHDDCECPTPILGRHVTGDSQLSTTTAEQRMCRTQQQEKDRQEKDRPNDEGCKKKVQETLSMSLRPKGSLFSHVLEHFRGVVSSIK